MAGHTVSSFDAEQSELDNKIARMGGLVEWLLWQSFQALSQRDPDLADRAARADRDIDKLEREIQERAIALINTHAPVADDLRHAVCVLAIASDLERIGDLSKSMARRTIVIAKREQPRAIVHGLRHMTEVAASQLKDTLDAWTHRDVQKANSVWSRDAALDALYSSLFREMIQWMTHDPRHIEHGIHLMFIAKNLERIGDHTTNIAERIRFLETGQSANDPRIKSDDTSGYLPQWPEG